MREACLGSCPCLHEKPELMVLKWRPDGDSDLIAAEGAPTSRPLLLSSYFSYKATSLYICCLYCLLSSSALLFYHSLLCQTQLRAVIVHFLSECDSPIVLYLNLSLSRQFFSSSIPLIYLQSTRQIHLLTKLHAHTHGLQVMHSGSVCRLSVWWIGLQVVKLQSTRNPAWSKSLNKRRHSQQEWNKEQKEKKTERGRERRKLGWWRHEPNVFSVLCLFSLSMLDRSKKEKIKETEESNQENRGVIESCLVCDRKDGGEAEELRWGTL